MRRSLRPWLLVWSGIWSGGQGYSRAAQPASARRRSATRSARVAKSRSWSSSVTSRIGRPPSEPADIEALARSASSAARLACSAASSAAAPTVITAASEARAIATASSIRATSSPISGGFSASGRRHSCVASLMPTSTATSAETLRRPASTGRKQTHVSRNRPVGIGSTRMKALVTGGAGFIGSNLADALAERRPDAIFHLAAQIDVRKSVADPAFDAAVNVGGTANVLEAARAAGCGRVVFSSTGGAIYGEGEGKQLPLPETAPPAPMSPYGQSKFAGEGYLALYERLYGLSTVALRLGNVYGPRQDPLGEAGVIAMFCGRLQAGEPPTVYGDGKQTRDYIYVGDVVAAMLAAAESDARGAFNVGTGIETDVLELVERLGALTNAENFDPAMAPPRPGEVQAISIDPGLAKRELGWEAQTGLDAGLRLTLDSLGL